MRRLPILLLAICATLTFNLCCKDFTSNQPSKDWLIDGSSFISKVEQSSDGKDVILTNGLVSRVFRITPNLATTNIYNNITGESMVRTACPEGTVTINGKDYSLGGLDGIEEYAYVKPEWLDGFTAIPNSFKVTGFRTEELKKRMEWNRKRWALIKDWDPKGKELIFTLEGPEEVKGVKVELHYEIYDGAPIIGKWLDVFNESGATINLDKFTLEELAIVEYETNVDHVPASPDERKIHVESDFAQVSCGTTYCGAAKSSMLLYQRLIRCAV